MCRKMKNKSSKMKEPKISSGKMEADIGQREKKLNRLALGISCFSWK